MTEPAQGSAAQGAAAQHAAAQGAAAQGAAEERPASNSAGAAPDFDPPLIDIDHLSKHFGSFIAVDDLCFQVRRGEVLGFRSEEHTSELQSPC